MTLLVTPSGFEGNMKKLPIGIQTFSHIIQDDYVYVDKTCFAHKLITSGKYYFLSRPRRFGKSLFLDTLSEILKGNKELFKGLCIHDQYDFHPHPVIRISFGSGDYIDEGGIKRELQNIFRRNIRDLGIESPINDDYRTCFGELIYNVFKQYGERVVILVDEYDKPILDTITNTEYALKARHLLKNFYSVIKDNDSLIQFVFITGVSKFSKMNLFSGLNNLEDITVDVNYAEICGYTHKDLDAVFKEHLKDADMRMVKRWYNGYYYFGETVYNPFDILLFISKGLEFRNYWWNTGNPSFLIRKLKGSQYYIPEIEQAVISEEGLDAFDVEHIDLLALLWQTGYLTFESRFQEAMGRVKYRLTIPNLEIQFSLNELFIEYLTNHRHEKHRYESNLLKYLMQNDFDGFISEFRRLFSSIPYTDYANNIIAQYEGYYCSVVFVYLSALGYEVIAEDVTNRGRIDITLKMDGHIVIIEFKVDSKERPINQIKERKYFEKYMQKGNRIYLLGVCFDSQERNIANYEVEKLGVTGNR